MESVARDPIRPPISPEEEAVKRNTDCVYFLASPLTCKKGNECEYRHSEGARVNPRDCWFWLNGNCLNPKCSFRHPPLDGLLGSPVGAAPGSTLPSVQTTTSTQVPAAYAPSVHPSNKQSTPCYFFQKGGCLKGDRCPFMHGVQPVNSSISQEAGKDATPSTEHSNTSKNPSWSLEKCVQQDKLEKSADKPVGVSHSLANPNAKAEIKPANGLAVKSSMLPAPLLDEMAHRFQTNTVDYTVSNSTDMLQGCHLQHVDEPIQNGREPDDSLRESSPGFDVLVDDEGEDTDYFHKDDEFGSASDYGGKNPNLENEFDYHHSDYDSVTKFDRETYNEIGEYDHHGRRDWYHQEQHRSSERTLKRSSIPEKRGPWRENSADKLDATDLRHRLLKQRRLNGPRSAISPDHHGELFQRDDLSIEEKRNQNRNSHRDQRNLPHESSISNRLQGRITLPGRPSTENYSNLQSDGVIDKGRNWGRSSSPGQPLNGQGRPHDVIKQKAHKDFTAEAWNIGGQPRRQDEVGSVNFAGPKSLAELKGAKFSGKSQVTLTKTDNSTIIREEEKSEGSLQFEGPKPLSVILKRKREEHALLSDGIEDNQRVIEERAGVLISTATTDNETIHLLESENGQSHTLGNIEVPKSTAVVEEEEEGLIVSDGEELPYQGQSSAKGEMLDTGDDKLADSMEEPEVENNKRDGESMYGATEGIGFEMGEVEGLPHPAQSLHEGEVLNTEGGMLIDDMENPDNQNYDQRDDEFEYDTTEGTNFKSEDGEYVYEEDEDMDDEDGDDFARKLGVMLS
uniref:Zinc finger CCCH domain-containing protein 19 n=1 Tax=Anthurium amnicola TaxID=1678845 RepID=A0A1D1Z4T2_9ARAE